MTKKQFNTQCTERLNENKVNLEMLIQAYALLDKQVSKYAYLKKKWANCDFSNEGYISEFTNAIQKRNAVEKVLKTDYHIPVDEIKSQSKGTDIQITIKNCDGLIDLINDTTRELTVER